MTGRAACSCHQREQRMHQRAIDMTNSKFDRKAGADVKCPLLAVASCVLLLAGAAHSPSAQPLTLLEPAAPAAYRVGDTVEIRWQADLALIDRVVLDISTDGGRDWETFSRNGHSPAIRNSDTAFYDGSTGSYRWIIPAKLFSMIEWDSVSLVSDSCLLRVWDPYSMEEHGEVYEARTEQAFAIKEAAAAVAFRAFRPAKSEKRTGKCFLVNGRRATTISATAGGAPASVRIHVSSAGAALSAHPGLRGQ